MSLVTHAERELKAAGLIDKDSDYGGMIAEAVLALVRVHAEQGHSGGSHATTIAVFNKVINFQPLTPITKADFVEVVNGPCGTTGLWQCARASSKFSTDGGESWYDIDKPLRFRRLRRMLGLRQFAP